jgi:hypothetical protein
MRILRTISILAFPVSLFSCSKAGNDNSAQSDTTTMKYAVAYVPDLQITQYRDTTILIQIAVKYVSGIPEPVTLSVSGHPDWAKPDSA